MCASGAPAGQSCAALVGPDGEWTRLTQTGSDARIPNMEAFARAALDFAEETLAGVRPSTASS